MILKIDHIHFYSGDTRKWQPTFGMFLEQRDLPR